MAAYLDACYIGPYHWAAGANSIKAVEELHKTAQCDSEIKSNAMQCGG